MKSPPFPEKPFVTVSRSEGCGSDAIIGSLCQCLGWQRFDREIIDHMASSASVRKEILESLDEKGKGMLEEWVLNFLSGSSFDQSDYFKHLVSVLHTIAAHGKAVIVGRGSNFVLKGRTGLRVLLVAPFEERVRNIVRSRGISPLEAEGVIRDDDMRRRAFLKLHFRVEYDDPSSYDLVLNTASFGMDTCVDFILSALRDRFREGLHA